MFGWNYGRCSSNELQIRHFSATVRAVPPLGQLNWSLITDLRLSCLMSFVCFVMYRSSRRNFVFYPGVTSVSWFRITRWKFVLDAVNECFLRFQRLSKEPKSFFWVKVFTLNRVLLILRSVHNNLTTFTRKMVNYFNCN